MEAVGGVEGVIVPPKELRKLIDLTASHVAKNEKDFESNMRRKMAGKAQFAFLEPGHPFHRYYVQKVDEIVLEQHNNQKDPKKQTNDSSSVTPIEAKASTESENKIVDEEEKKQEERTKTSEVVAILSAPKLDPTAEAFKKDRKGKPPPDYMFTLNHPLEELDSQKIDLIKLVAKHSAILGHKFVLDIARREASNPEFNFLRPSDPHFSYFESMTAAYRKVLDWDRTMEKVNEKFKSKVEIIDRAVHRVEHARILEQEKLASTEQTTEEVIAFHQIDWHDFALVGTIDFEEISPTTENSTKLAPKTSEKSIAANESDNDDMDMDSDDDEKLPVQKDYKPKIATGDVRATAVVLPDGSQISDKQLNEHMRINMLHPKYKEQTQKFMDRQKTTALLEKDGSKHLERMAAHQPEIFGVREEVAQAVRVENKRKMDEAGLVWDGSAKSAAQLQLAARQRKFENHRTEPVEQPQHDFSIGPAPPQKQQRQADDEKSLTKNPAAPPPPPPPKKSN